VADEQRNLQQQQFELFDRVFDAAAGLARAGGMAVGVRVRVAASGGRAVASGGAVTVRVLEPATETDVAVPLDYAKVPRDVLRVVAAGIPSGEAFGAPTVQPGAVSITARTGDLSGESSGASRASGEVTVTPRELGEQLTVLSAPFAFAGTAYSFLDGTDAATRWPCAAASFAITVILIRHPQTRRGLTWLYGKMTGGR
jgi:hypothetical protein